MIRWIKHASINRRTGLTLIELLIVIMMLGLLGATVTTMFVTGMKVFSEDYTRQDLRLDIGQALQRIVRDVRQAKTKTVISTQIDFTADLDAAISGDETYRYRLVSNELRWSRVNPNPTPEVKLAQNLDLPASSFNDSSHLIAIELQGARDAQTVVFRSQARPRNF
jgi:prepilin-type N-terminal cleavage/methylation domain-containing protein